MKSFRWLYARLVFRPTLLWNMFNARVLKRWNWWDLVDDTVIIGALPSSGHVDALKELGVTGVVNTCEEYQGPVAQYEVAGIEQLYVPTVDFTHPSLEAVEKGVAFIQRHSDTGGLVYVHCKAGRARSATIVVCWLIHAHGLTPAEAQRHLQERRKHVNPRVFERTVVRAFYEKHVAASEASAATGNAQEPRAT